MKLCASKDTVKRVRTIPRMGETFSDHIPKIKKNSDNSTISRTINRRTINHTVKPAGKDGTAISPKMNKRY